jgi:hypothetical protein
VRATRPPGAIDHLVGAKQDRLRHRKAECLGGLEVDDHLELGRKLHGKIARLRAAQNAIDISRSAAKEVYLVDSVGEPAAVSGKVRYEIDSRYVVSGRRQYDRRAMRGREYIRHDDLYALT